MAADGKRSVQIVIGNVEPGVVNTAGPNTPTQIADVGNTGIVNFGTTLISANSKIAQVAPAMVFPTADPMVLNAAYWSGSTLTKSSQAS